VDTNSFEKPIDLQTETAHYAEEWAEIVLERFQEAMERYRVAGQTQDLFNSFKKQLTKSGGDVDAVIFKFLKYGRFVDMGVGKGVSLGKRTINRQMEVYKDYRGKKVNQLKRKRKPFYSKTFYREVAILAKIYREQIGDKTIQTLESALSGQITLNI
jgi:hypothetical protein